MFFEILGDFPLQCLTDAVTVTDDGSFDLNLKNAQLVSTSTTCTLGLLNAVVPLLNAVAAFKADVLTLRVSGLGRGQSPEVSLFADLNLQYNTSQATGSMDAIVLGRVFVCPGFVLTRGPAAGSYVSSGELSVSGRATNMTFPEIEEYLAMESITIQASMTMTCGPSVHAASAASHTRVSHVFHLQPGHAGSDSHASQGQQRGRCGQRLRRSHEVRCSGFHHH